MTAKPLFKALFFVCLFGGPPAAAENLTVNGFFDDKAILTVDGKPTIFTVGESRDGVTLLETGQDYALVRVGGKNKMLFMDQAIPKHLVDPQAYQQNSTAKSHIIAIRLLHQSDNTATFAVEYFFNVDEAEYAVLSAKTRFRGKITPYWTYTVTSLKPGRHTTTITVGMSEDAPASYISDAVYFDIMPVTGSKVIEFVKEWKKQNHESADDRRLKVKNNLKSKL